MVKGERIAILDFLRGLAIFLMIFDHTAAYYLFDKTVFFFWDYSHIIVPLLIYVSSVLFFSKPHPLKKDELFMYFKKRFWRLLLPYYLFVLALFPLLLIVEKTKLTFPYMIGSFIFTSGEDINWLVLLFLYIAFLCPFIAYLKTIHRTLFYAFGTMALISSIALVFIRIPVNYKLTMWLPWTIIVYLGFFATMVTNRYRFFTMTLIVSIMSFILLQIIQTHLHHNLVLQENKYPPNLYYLSWGIFWLSLFNLTYHQIIAKITPLIATLKFFSVHSYSLFFIHYFVLYAVARTQPYWQWPWYKFFLLILIISIVIQYLLNHILKIAKRETF